MIETKELFIEEHIGIAPEDIYLTGFTPHLKSGFDHAIILIKQKKDDFVLFRYCVGRTYNDNEFYGLNCHFSKQTIYFDVEKTSILNKEDLPPLQNKSVPAIGINFLENVETKSDVRLYQFFPNPEQVKHFCKGTGLTERQFWGRCFDLCVHCAEVCNGHMAKCDERGGY